MLRPARAFVALTVAAAVSAVGCSNDDAPAERVAPTTTTTLAPATTTTAATPIDQPGPVDQTPPASANGVVLVDDRLFVASLAGGEILAVDPASGRITARFGADAGVESPDDVAVAPDGSLYFTAYTAGWVGRLDRSGRAERVATLEPGVNPIAFSVDGRLAVGRAVIGDGLWEIDPTGAAAPRLVAGELGNVNAFAFGADGALYGPRFGLEGAGAVVRVDVDTGAIDTVAAGLSYPVAVRFSPTGDLLVAQESPPSVVHLDLATGTYDEIARVEHAIDNFAVAPDGTLYVTGFNLPVVSVVRPDGSVTRVAIGDG